jgi:hypothetical protein
VVDEPLERAPAGALLGRLVEEVMLDEVLEDHLVGVMEVLPASLLVARLTAHSSRRTSRVPGTLGRGPRERDQVLANRGGQMYELIE